MSGGSLGEREVVAAVSQYAFEIHFHVIPGEIYCLNFDRTPLQRISSRDDEYVIDPTHFF
jgi:hypothetical protein